MRRGKKWLPEVWPFVEHVPFHGSIPMQGGCTRRGFTVHDEGEARECKRQHRWLAEYVNYHGVPYTLAYCSWCGRWLQMLPMTHAALSLKGGAIVGNGASANKAGQRNIQICFIGFANGRDAKGRRITDTPMKNLWVLAEIMDAHKIPWRARKVWGPGASRSRKAWLRSGIHGHQHSPAPYEDHTDPGDLDIHKLMREARRQQKARRKRQARR